MWKRFKKRVNNWMFEEVEEEVEREEGHQSTHTEKRSPEAKMMYQYPKQPPFRFPVIRDNDAQGQTHISSNKQRYVEHQIGHETDIELSKRQAQFRKRTVKKVEKMRTIQDVPAYLRRQKNEQAEKKIVADDSHHEEQLILPHTKPDELDAIFRKRNNSQTGEDKGNDSKENDKQVEYDIASEKLKDVTNESSYINDITTMPNQKNENSQNRYETDLDEEKQVIKDGQNKQHIATEKQCELTKVDQAPDDIDSREPNREIEYQNDDNSNIPLYLLDDPVEENRQEDEQWIKDQTYLLERTLKHFNVKAHVVNATQGSSVTRFEVKPEMGVKVSRIRNLTDDIKLNLAAKDIRIEAPIPGRHTVGIEVPNKNAYPVGLQEIIQTNQFDDSESPLTIALGVTIEGEPLITTIGKMPHCLIAGATGSGKSVCINTILLSLMYKASYNDVKFLLIDPKMVELAPYNGIPHLISPVITDVKAATASLKWAVNEMEDRYEQFANARVRDISRFNEKVQSGHIDEEKMPYIVIVIDELADLMMASPQDVEDSICRIAQKARACGIHLLLATQRPSVDVITGLIKANIPTRISFSVTSQVDSRTIIDTVGAEKLLGKGDMLFVENGASEIVRLQGPFVSDDEVERITSHACTLGKPNYLFEQEQLLQETIQHEEEDELLEDIIYFVIEHNQASTSLLQRRFRIGYNRAARLIDTLEAKGIISEQNGTKPRDVLITKSQLEEL